MNDTSTLDLLLWVVLPYMVLAVFVLGHVWRFRADRFGWTTRSSQIYESKLLSIGSPMFLLLYFFGLLAVLFPNAFFALHAAAWAATLLVLGVWLERRRRERFAAMETGPPRPRAARPVSKAPSGRA